MTALAAGAVWMTGALSDRTEPVRVASPSTVNSYALEPLKVADFVIPVSPGSFGDGFSRAWTRTRDVRVLEYNGRDGADGFSITVTPDRPGDVYVYQQQGESFTMDEESITAGGHPAVLRTDPRGVVSPRVAWELPSGEWAEVAAQRVERAREVADGVRNEGVRIPARVSSTLAPTGYQPEEIHGEDKPVWDSPATLSLCQGSTESEGFTYSSGCYTIGTMRDLSLADGPEPDPSGKCTKQLLPLEKVGDKPPPLEMGAPRQVDGSTVRLSSNGCTAVKVFGDSRFILVNKMGDAELTADDFARLAAATSVR